MICGELCINIIDNVYGTDRHTFANFSTVAIGEIVSSADADYVPNANAEPTADVVKNVHFSCEFNYKDKYAQCHIDNGHIIKGELLLRTSSDKNVPLMRQILTLVAIEPKDVKAAIKDSTDVRGIGLLEYTKKFNSHPIEILYHLEHVKDKHFISCITFTISMDKLIETKNVIQSLNTARLLEL